MISLPMAAYALGGVQMPAAQEAKRRKYAGSIPEIAKAYENDPQTKLANSALAAGTSMAPVAQGGYAIPDGLARAAQAIMGAVAQKNNRKEYAGREADFMSNLATATAGAGEQQQFAPAQTQFANPAPVEHTQGGPVAGAQPVSGAQQAAAALAPPAPRPVAPMAPQRPPAGLAPPSAPGAPVTAPRGPAAAPTPGAPIARNLYYGGIVPIEGGTDAKGNFRTSPKGAIGPGQVMPGTAPEAAKLAGVPFDDHLYRTNAEYNNKLGEAYYAKQLADFGDPVAAAAAYNAGPGRVRRAMRLSQRSGQDWTAHVPPETRKYVENFKVKITQSLGGGGGGPSDLGQSLGQAAVPQAQMEAVPEAMEMPTAAPQAPGIPQQVRSNRLAIAQKLLQSGNPDLVAMAQTYLDKGMEENFQSATASNAQAADLTKTGYQSALNDFGDARNTARGQQVTDRTNAMSRNAEREQLQNTQTFTAGESELDRISRERMAAAGDTAAMDRLTTEYGLKEQLAGAKPPKNPFYDTPTGLRMQQDLLKTITNTNGAKEKANEMLALIDKVPTGGVYGLPMGIGSTTTAIRDAFNDDANTLSSLGKQMTLDMMPNGSLGAQVSNSDRDFVERAQAGAASPADSARILATMYRNAAQRRQEQAKAEIDAYANQTITTFGPEWARYIEDVPLLPRDKNGKPLYGAKSPTFTQWQQRKVMR